MADETKVSRRSLLKTGSAVIAAGIIGGALGYAANAGPATSGTTTLTRTSTTTVTASGTKSVSKVGSVASGAVIPSSDPLPYEVGMRKGFFADQGVDNSVVQFRGGVPMIDALTSGQIKTMLSVTPSVANVASKGTDVVMIAPEFENFIFGVMVNSDSKVNSFQDLKGQSVGTSAFGSASYFLYVLIAQKLGWNIGTDLKIVPLGGFDALTAALVQNKIQAAAWTWDGVLTLQKQGKVRVIADGSEFAPPGTWFHGAIVSSHSFVNSNPELVQAFLKAWYKSVSYIYNNLDEASAIGSEYWSLNDKDLARDIILKSNYSTITQFTPLMVKGISSVVDLLVKTKTIEKAPDVQSLYTNRFSNIGSV